MPEEIKDLQKKVATLENNMEGVTKQLRDLQIAVKAGGGKVDPEFADFMKFAKSKLKYQTPGQRKAADKAADKAEKKAD